MGTWFQASSSKTEKTTSRGIGVVESSRLRTVICCVICTIPVQSCTEKGCERSGVAGVKVRRCSEEAPQSRGYPGAQQSPEGWRKSPGKKAARAVPPPSPAFNNLIAQIIMFIAEN